ncbi:MAG: hypothetical protein M3536_11925, partial [Actinomycetota bacterium]|nr:hypothetical protein [Actinomycetota bacterium]
MHNDVSAARATTRMLVCLLLATLGIVIAPAAGAAPSPGEGTQQTLGNDVSWPQCNKALPKNPAFGIVGVNNGLANTTNPCLAGQLKWAEAIPVEKNSTGQPTVALYVNTANPGLAGSWWPTSNEYPAGTVVHNPYGRCKAPQATAACSYMYGYAKAYDDAYIRGISNPGTYLWWLDVETGNSWTDDQEANRAVLEGMTDFFNSIQADVGIYSTGFQWGQIVGPVSSSSSLYSLPSWLAGARTATGAKANCSNAPLTAGGKVTLTQFVSKGFDYDHSCT